MELRVLKYFLAVARHQNITRAAEELHLTQPTLSRQLQDLEEELGAPLFTREKRRMELTEAGLFLKARAEEMARETTFVTLDVTDAAAMQKFLDELTALLLAHETEVEGDEARKTDEHERGSRVEAMRRHDEGAERHLLPAGDPKRGL